MMIDLNRYKQIPSPGPSPAAPVQTPAPSPAAPSPGPGKTPSPAPGPGSTPANNPNQSPQLYPNTSPAFGPFRNLYGITYSQVNLVNEVRYLWLQMVIWSRSYANVSKFKPEAASFFFQRLYSVPVGFYYYMNLIFGRVIAEQFIILLSHHIAIFSDLVNALLAGNQQGADTSRAEWYENADQIAAYLSQINETWDFNQWQRLLDQYLEMLLDETVAILSGNYQNEIAIYDRLQYQALLIADYMSGGVMNSLLGNNNGQQNRGR